MPSEAPSTAGEVYSLERLSRSAIPTTAFRTSLWLFPFPEDRIAEENHDPPNVGDFLSRSCLFQEGFKEFLKASGTLPTDFWSRRYDTGEWSELGQSMEERTGLSTHAYCALKQLRRDIVRRRSHSGEETPEAYVDSWIDAALHQGHKANVPSPDLTSLVQSHRYRVPPILIGYLSTLRLGNDAKSQKSARVVSDWLQADVIDGDADQRQWRQDRDERMTVDRLKAEKSRKVLTEWWHV
jgi:hypothetical protein